MASFALKSVLLRALHALLIAQNEISGAITAQQSFPEVTRKVFFSATHHFLAFSAVQTHVRSLQFMFEEASSTFTFESLMLLDFDFIKKPSMHVLAAIAMGHERVPIRFNLLLRDSLQ